MHDATYIISTAEIWIVTVQSDDSKYKRWDQATWIQILIPPQQIL